MTPVAVPKSVELFNRLTDLDLGDVEEARSIQFHLGGLLQHQPGDPQLRVSMAQACRIVGERHFALEHLAVADALWRSAHLTVKSRIVGQWTALGHAERALARSTELDSDQSAAFIPEIMKQSALTAAYGGRLDILHAVAERENASKVPGFANNILTSLARIGLDTHFFCAMKIVSDVLAHHAMEISLGIPIHPDDGREYILWKVSIDGSSVHRWEIDDLLDDRLEEYFSKFDGVKHDWWWKFGILTTNAPRLSSIPAAPKPDRLP